MAWFRLIYAAILGTALLNFINILLLVSGDTYLAVIAMESLHAQVLIFLKAFNDTCSLGLIVFGLHILVLGYLVLKSGYIPKFFGVFLTIAFFGYLITNIANLILPDYDNFKTTIELIFIIPMVVGEVGLAVWLLIRGVKVQIDH